MKNLSKFILACVLLSAPLFVNAQDDDAAKTFIYASYFYCDPAGEEAADAQVESLWKPVYDAAVEAGTISGWGYFSHHTGGKWRRLVWYSDDSIAGLLEAQQSTAAAIDEAAGEDSSNDFGSACASHDDYVWEVTNGSAPSDESGAVMSTYHVCSLTGDDRAAEIIDTEFAPILNKHVEAGNLTSWGALEHRIGGKYRRIDTLAAKDAISLIKATAELYPELGATESSDEFSKICRSHTDYIWNVVH